MNKSRVIQLARPWQQKEAVHDTAKDSALIEKQTEEFLASGGKVEIIKDTLVRTAEELGHMHYKAKYAGDEDKYQAHRVRVRKASRQTSAHTSLASRTELSEVVK